MNQEQKESFSVYLKESRDFYRKRKKKRLKIIFSLVLTVFFFFVLKFFTGEIVISLGMPFVNKRYEVTLNQHLFEVFGESKKKVPILPFFLYFGQNASIWGWQSKEVIPFSNSERYLLDVKVFNCYYSGQPIDCRPYKKDIEEMKEEKKNITYSLKIYNYKNYDATLDYREYLKKTSTMSNEAFQLYQQAMREENFRLIYDGPFVSDITEFIDEEGLYGFILTGKYGWIKDKVKMGLVNNGQEIELINIVG